MNKKRINELLSRHGKVIKISHSEDVFHENSLCQNFIFVKSGTVKVYKVSEEGKELVLYRVDHDNLCTLTTSCVLSGTYYPAFAKAETDVEAVVITKAVFDQLIQAESFFRDFVFSSLSSRFASLVEKIDEICFHTLQARLIKHLLYLKEGANPIEMTHQDLANELGTEREIISRILKKLEKNGSLKLKRGQIEVFSFEGDNCH